MAERAQIAVSGIVQGVGFRPYVYALATGLGLKGYVTNTASGVLIDVEGSAVPAFIRRLPAEAPPLSRITDLAVIPLPLQGTTEFTIKASQGHGGERAFTHVSPDVSVCADCLRELADPEDRRYRYPFINCTNCGPRYTITKAVPYDRPNTTMASFSLCPACSREYNDPADRRFHAQPNACPACGPKCEFKLHNAKLKTKEEDPVRAAGEVLRQGGIIAVKGVGGFHIACDALNEAAVLKLRERKRKSNKPFAVMAANLADESQSWVLAPDGTYTRDLTPRDGQLFNCHQFFMENPSLSGRGTAGAKDAPRLVSVKDDDVPATAAARQVP